MLPLLILLALLGHDRFPVREAAQQALRPAALLCHATLERFEAHSDCPETRRRLSRLLAMEAARHADRRSRALGRLPPVGLLGVTAGPGATHEARWAVWNDMERWLTCAALALGRPAELARWHCLGGWVWDLGNDPGLQREATRLMARDLLARRHDPLPLLDLLRAEERSRWWAAWPF